MKEYLEMIKLYSVQVIMALASLNVVMAVWTDAPAWLVTVVNIAGVIAHHIARAKPQPVVTANIQRLKNLK